MKHIESDSNATLKQWKKLHTKKEREKTGTFLLEGPHLIEEAISSGAKLQHVIIEENFTMEDEWLKEKFTLWSVPTRLMKQLSETEKPQGIMAVCEMMEEPEERIEKNGRYLLIDGVQDPGNLGTIIRTADSAGLDGVFLGEGTADLYNGKTVRSTQGSLFHLPIIKADLREIIAECKTLDIPVISTSLQGAVDMRKLPYMNGFALIMGNEGSGVQAEFQEESSLNVKIPIFGQAESLNVSVATGILLYELQRNR
ncbi:TrmH family RNA methyltransferase [Fictibacillus phosphorivorans]|uniref:TrmH family RNA methyltransferase n=1 Tax=Fictibacillus phosphorivorans TaxID=1221500 RepID=UPI00204077CD|nr:RNA methyltransferase [Fictibacillus phosphorivorans]MCM3717879.1 RNA methyltransferase [Fictibacillus phosphorivorans]MCM3775328.1 RNA methyltransferase [Fictibacillus phosphorivorans]